MAIITICRQLGSLGDEIADELAKDLNYQLLSKETLANLLRDSGFTEKKEIDMFSAGEKPSLLNRFVFNRGMFSQYVKKALYEFAQNQNVIIMGMGGQSIFYNLPAALRVRIIAPKEIRLQRIQADNTCDVNYANHLIQDSDLSRANFYKYIFGIDWEDMNLYDLVINTRITSLSSAVKIIKAELQAFDTKEQVQETANNLDNLLLKQKVLIALSSDKEIELTNISVSVEDGAVTLTGWVRSFEKAKLCKSKVKEIHGVKSVLNRTTINDNLKTFLNPWPANIHNGE